jgi:hypothetical protein
MHPVHSILPQLSDTVEVQLRVFPLSFSWRAADVGTSAR